jgi:hypothetical protein
MTIVRQGTRGNSLTAFNPLDLLPPDHIDRLAAQAAGAVEGVKMLRAERDALRERVARLELALSYIAAEANRSNSNIVHIKRIIAAQTRAAIEEHTPND